jgi:BACON domain-containing protein
MRTLPLTAGSIMAALCLTACDATGPNPDERSEKGSKAAPAIAVAPQSLTFQIYAFAPQVDPPAKTLAVSSVGGGSMVWSARSTAHWISLGHAGGSAPGQLQVAVSRAGLHLGLNGYRPQGLTGMITVSSAGAAQVQIPVSILISEGGRKANYPVRAASNAAAEGNRSAGALASARSTTRSSPGPTSGRTVVSGGTWPAAWRQSIARAVAPVNGVVPASISYSTQPSA